MFYHFTTLLFCVGATTVNVAATSQNPGQADLLRAYGGLGMPVPGAAQPNNPNQITGLRQPIPNQAGYYNFLINRNC